MELLDDEHSDRVAREATKSVVTGVIASGLFYAQQEMGIPTATVIAILFMPLAILFYEAIERMYGRPK